MSAPEPSALDGTRRLAGALVRAALRTLPRLSPPAREPALAAIDAFVAQPGPARFLAASRALDEARRLQRNEELGEALKERAFAHGLLRLRELPFVDEELGAELAALPIDPRAGRRLEALAALLEAHDELAARVRKAIESRRPILRLPAEPERVTAFHRVRRSARPRSRTPRTTRR